MNRVPCAACCGTGRALGRDERIAHEVDRMAGAIEAKGLRMSWDRMHVYTDGAAFLLDKSEGTLQNWCYAGGPVVGHRKGQRGPLLWSLRELAEYRLYLVPRESTMDA